MPKLPRNSSDTSPEKQKERYRNFVFVKLYGSGRLDASLYVDDPSEVEIVKKALSSSIKIVASFHEDIFRTILTESGFIQEKVENYSKSVIFDDETILRASL